MESQYDFEGITLGFLDGVGPECPLEPPDFEGIAKRFHDETGVRCPVDAFELADLCGLDTRPWSASHGEIKGTLIRYPGGARLTRQHGVVAHEIGHWLLRRHGFEMRNEKAARYLAGALMLPVRRFLSDLERTDWHLFDMLDIHVNVSAEMCAARMCQVSPAVTTIFDQGTFTRRYFAEGAARDDGHDAELADRALDLETPVRDGVVCAWPMIDREHRRVVVVRRAA